MAGERRLTLACTAPNTQKASKKSARKNMVSMPANLGRCGISGKGAEGSAPRRARRPTTAAVAPRLKQAWPAAARVALQTVPLSRWL